MKRTTISLTTPCGVCNGPIGVIEPWGPYKDTIAHDRCLREAFEGWASERGEPLNDETYYSWQLSLDDETFTDPDLRDGSGGEFDAVAPTQGEVW